MHTDVSGNPEFQEILGRVRDVLLAAYAHQDVPFDEVVAAVNPERSLRHAPLFQVKLNLQNTPPALEVPGLSILPLAVARAAVQLDLIVNLTDTRASLAGSVEYSTDLFDTARIARLTRRYEAVLRYVGTHADARPDALARVLEDAEARERLATAAGLGEGSVRTLKAAKRRPVRVEQENLVTSEGSGHGQGRRLPLLVRPAASLVDLPSWAGEHRERICAQLREHGGILFRGFKVRAVAEFERVMGAIASELVPYHERSSPRRRVSGNVYTSTDHPADQTIFVHNENSYQSSWPRKVFFFCITPAAGGGRTPIADCRNVFERIRPEIREQFIRRKILYVRNYGDGFGLPWQEVFQTSDRAAVEEHCRRNSIVAEWKAGGRLRTRAVRPAVVRHPETGRLAWFNHATFFHESTLEPSVREALRADYAPEDLPTTSYYGDGRAIEPQVLDELRAAYRQETHAFTWERGDLLVLDNILAAHGRAPYDGDRKIVVGMGRPILLGRRRDQLTTHFSSGAYTMNLKGRDFINLMEFTTAEIEGLLDLAMRIKAGDDREQYLKGKYLGHSSASRPRERGSRSRSARTNSARRPNITMRPTSR